MTLLDTNVLIEASIPTAPHHVWARRTIVAAVSGSGAAIDSVTLAELCVGDAVPDEVAPRIRSWGVEILDVPAAASEICAKAYALYRRRRLMQSGKESPAMPLPDFFIGAHAQIMGWTLATADIDRFRVYFPKLRLSLPAE